MLFVLFIKIPAAISSVFIGLIIKQCQLLMHGCIKGLQAGKGDVAKGCIHMGINDVYSPFYHSLIPGAVGAGGTKGGLIMFAKLVAQVCKDRLVAAGSYYSGLKVIAQNSGGHTRIIAKHSIDTGGKIVRFLRRYRQAINKTAKGKNSNKHLACNQLSGRCINVMLMLAGKVNHDHISRLVLQVHRYFFVLLIFIKMITILAVSIAIGVLL